MAKKKLLIVEDNQSLAITYQAILRESLYEVDWVDSMTDARLLLESGSHDIVLLDLKLPDGDGLDLLKGNDSIASFAKVVVMTAYGSTQISEESFERGAVDYLQKPFNADRLLVALKKAEVLQDAGENSVSELEDELHTLNRLKAIFDLESDPLRTDLGSDSSEGEDVEPLWRLEKKAIMHALDKCDGNIPDAAALLEISPEKLRKKLQSWLDE